jgi:hypothetical protein
MELLSKCGSNSCPSMFDDEKCEKYDNHTCEHTMTPEDVFIDGIAVQLKKYFLRENFDLHAWKRMNLREEFKNNFFDVFLSPTDHNVKEMILNLMVLLDQLQEVESDNG